MFRVPAFAVETQDSTGAGDCFAAGFVAGFLGSLDLTGSAVLGSVLGAMSAAHVGAASVAPRARAVLAMLRGPWPGATEGDNLKSIERVVDFVRRMSAKPEEEGKPWWA